MNIFLKRYWLILASILVCGASGLYFRLYPLRHYQPDNAQDRATLYVLNQLRQRVTDKVQISHPNLSKEQQDILASNFLSEILKTEKEHVKSAIQKVSLQLGDSRGSADYPYLLASDSFYYYEMTRRLVEDGQYSDLFKGSKFFHHLMLAPVGHWEPINWHPYIGLTIFQIAKLFNPEIPLMYAVSFTPLVVSTLALIPFFLAGLALGCRPLALLPAGLAFTLAPIFIKRSAFGWYDNDPYNVFFPLIILAIIFHSLNAPQSRKSATLTGLGLAGLIGIYAYFWQGWVFFFGTLITALLIRILYGRFSPHKGLITGQPLILLSAALGFGTFLVISCTFGAGEFFVLFKEGWIALRNFMEPQLSKWPDLYMSVGELKAATWIDITTQMGGFYFLLIAFGGLGTSVLMALRGKGRMNPSALIFLGTFLILSLLIARGAQRFIILSLPPMSLSFALGLHWLLILIEIVTQKSIRPQPVLRITCTGLSITLIVLTTFLPLQNIHRKLPHILTPIYNSIWDRSLLFLEKETPTESIINTWWPPGHFIKAIARRSVSFDGASINYPQSYWIANALLQDDENMSLGIIRMLNNSGNLAVEYLQNRGLSTVQTVALIREIVKRDDFRARMILSGTLKDPQEISEILKMTHTQPPPSYFFLYNEFVDNNIQLRFFGNWNFVKIAEINADPKKIAEVPPRRSKKYIDFLWNLAGGPNRYSGILNEISRQDGLILFQHNLSVDEKTKASFIRSQQYGHGIPFSVFYEENGKVKEKIQEGGNKSYSVVLIQDQNRYQAILMDRYLAQSMLMQMYFFDAKNLKHIRLVYQDSDLTGRTKIKIFKVDWPTWQDSLQ